MLEISTVKGAIFDVDDTLLNNGTMPDPTKGLHARSRLVAVHEIGNKYQIAALRELSAEDNVLAHHTAKIHTLAGAVWNLLYMKGLVDSDDIDATNELLQEIVALKTKNHADILRTYGKEITGAGTFIRALASKGLQNKMAIASSAVRSEIEIFLDISKLKQYFPDDRIIAVEDVTRYKPDPQPFDLAFKKLNLSYLDRSNVLAFEDDPRGVQSAKAAGLYVCAITTRFKDTPDILIDAGADTVADSYQEFSEMLGVDLREYISKV